MSKICTSNMFVSFEEKQVIPQPTKSIVQQNSPFSNLPCTFLILFSIWVSVYCSRLGWSFKKRTESLLLNLKLVRFCIEYISNIYFQHLFIYKYIDISGSHPILMWSVKTKVGSGWKSWDTFVHSIGLDMNIFYCFLLLCFLLFCFN